MSWEPDPATFLSGRPLEVPRRTRLLRRAGDTLLDASLRRRLRSVDALAAGTPPRDVLVISVYRSGGGLLESALPRLESRRHSVRLAFGAMTEPSPQLGAVTVASGLAGGKFENVNEILGAAATPDWLIIMDDDVALPARFLDRFLALCERFGLALAQPAQSLASHAAWPHVRRRPRSLVREARLVEIGPVTAFRRDVLEELAPFPPLRYGWGLDLAWGALALERGWRLGIVDATPVRHEHARIAAAYSSEDAIGEARRFLADRPYVSSASAVETVARHARVGR